jgi:hypothetical protein
MLQNGCRQSTIKLGQRDKKVLDTDEKMMQLGRFLAR